MPVSIAIADSHTPAAEALAGFIQTVGPYQVVIMAQNGRDLLNQLYQKPLPDIALVELNMPVMDGFETMNQLQKLYPSIRVLAMTTSDSQENTVRAIRSGARGYLRKESGMVTVGQALNELMARGTHFVDGQRSPSAREAGVPALAFDLNNREYRFLKMACSELTYNEIADQMCVSPRTVDGYREMVFQKMCVRSRVGMVIKAMRYNLVDL